SEFAGNGIDAFNCHGGGMRGKGLGTGPGRRSPTQHRADPPEQDGVGLKLIAHPPRRARDAYRVAKDYRGPGMIQRWLEQRRLRRESGRSVMGAIETYS